MGQMLERVGEFCSAWPTARIRRLAVDQKGLEKPRRGLQLGVFLDGEPRLAARHRVALARVLDGGLKQHVERHAVPPLRLGRLERQHPAADRARHGERGERPARGNLVVAGIAIEAASVALRRRAPRP